MHHLASNLALLLHLIPDPRTLTLQEAAAANDGGAPDGCGGGPALRQHARQDHAAHAVAHGVNAAGAGLLQHVLHHLHSTRSTRSIDTSVHAVPATVAVDSSSWNGRCSCRDRWPPQTLLYSADCISILWRAAIHVQVLQQPVVITWCATALLDLHLDWFAAVYYMQTPPYPALHYFGHHPCCNMRLLPQLVAGLLHPWPHHPSAPPLFILGTCSACEEPPARAVVTASSGDAAATQAARASGSSHSHYMHPTGPTTPHH